MKNRTLIGIICIVIAVAVTFGVSPFVNKISEGKIKVIVFSKDIVQGNEITEDDIAFEEIPKQVLPEKYISEKDKVVGMYAVSVLYKGDVATENKISGEANTPENVFGSLSDGKVAMSITISSFAAGLSGKLRNGDIVSVYVTDKNNVTSVPAELNNVKVITTTTSGGVDESDIEKNEDGTFDLPSTVTVLVTPEQAVLLANYEKNASLHLALVYRGTQKNAKKYTDKSEG